MSNALSLAINEINPVQLRQALAAGLSPPTSMRIHAGAGDGAWSADGSALDVVVHQAIKNMNTLRWNHDTQIYQKANLIAKNVLEVIDLLAPYDLTVNKEIVLIFVKNYADIKNDPGTVYSPEAKKLVKWADEKGAMWDTKPSWFASGKRTLREQIEQASPGLMEAAGVAPPRLPALKRSLVHRARR